MSLFFFDSIHVVLVTFQSAAKKYCKKKSRAGVDKIIFASHIILKNYSIKRNL